MALNVKHIKNDTSTYARTQWCVYVRSGECGKEQLTPLFCPLSIAFGQNTHTHTQQTSAQAIQIVIWWHLFLSDIHSLLFLTSRTLNTHTYICTNIVCNTKVVGLLSQLALWTLNRRALTRSHYVKRLTGLCA